MGISRKISDFFEASIALHLSVPTCDIPVGDQHSLERKLNKSL